MYKILLMTFEYPTGRKYCGGVGQIVKQCRDALAGLNNDVYVLISPAFRKKRPLRVLMPDNTIKKYESFYSFQKEHSLADFDMIIQHFVNWTQALMKLKKRRGKRPKIIYHFHSILRRERDAGFKTFNRFLLNQEKMIEMADQIICPSNYEYENFNRYFPYFSEKVQVIENTIETFPPQAKIIEELRKKYRIKKNDIVSIYVGRLERIKGAHILINELPQILKKRKNKKIFIVGKSAEKGLHRKLRKLLKEYPKRIFYIKYLKKNILYQLYYLSDIYINTSLSESFSLSTHESAYCGNVLLLNRIPVFDKFENEALFFSGHESNGESFAHQYEGLMQSKHLRNRLSRKSRNVARKFVAKDRLKREFRKLLKAG